MLFAGDFPLNSTAQERGASVRDSTPMRWPGAPAFRAWRARALPVKLGSGGVGEWLNPAVLKFARLIRVRALSRTWVGTGCVKKGHSGVVGKILGNDLGN